MPFAIKPKQRVLFIGDSITDCGRRGNAAPLGDGYVRMISELIVARYPAHQLQIINTGISSHTVRDLRDRWTDDAIRFQLYISVDHAPGVPRSAILERLPLYIKTVDKMARKYKTRHVKTHDVFQRALKYVPAENLSPEPVHPWRSGHLVIAHEWLKAVGW